MRLVISIILIAFLSLALEHFLPWWSMAIVCFLIALLFRFSWGKAFLAGFAGIFLLWLIVGLMKSHANEHILSSRMAELFFQSPNYILFIITAAVIGGLVGGLAGWSGAVVRKYFAR